MNYKPALGWYYTNLNDRTPSWTGVEFLCNFLVENTGVGPFAELTDITEAQPGDIIQLKFDKDIFQHSPVVVKTGRVPSPSNIFIAAHTYDIDYKLLGSYSYKELRCLHILGVRK